MLVGVLMLMTLPFYNIGAEDVSQRLDNAGCVGLAVRAVLFTLPLVYPWRTIRSPVLWGAMFLLLLGGIWLALSALIANRAGTLLSIALQLGFTAFLGMHLFAVIELRRCSWRCPTTELRVP